LGLNGNQNTEGTERPQGKPAKDLNNTQSREGKKELTPIKTEKIELTRNWQDKTCNTNSFEFYFS